MIFRTHRSDRSCSEGVNCCYVDMFWCSQEDSGEMVKSCMVKGCRSRSSDGSGCRFFSIPVVSHQHGVTQKMWADRHRRWIEAAGHDASEFELKKHHRICSNHFVSGIHSLAAAAG